MVSDTPTSTRAYPYVLLAIVFSVACFVGAWFGVQHKLQADATESYQLAQEEAQLAIQRVSNDLSNAVHLLQSFPTVLSHDQQIQQSTDAINQNSDLYSTPIKERQQILLNESSETIQLLTKAIEKTKGIQALFITRKDGIVIATNDSDFSLLGHSAAGRHFFKSAIAGKPAYEYVTHPNKNEEQVKRGVAFSVPIFDITQKNIVGTLSAVIHLDNIANWVGISKGFIIDKYGVVLDSTDSNYQFKVLPDTTVNALPVEERLVRYQQQRFKGFSITPYPYENNLFSIGDEETPYFVLSAELEGYGLRLIAAIECAAVARLHNNYRYLFVAILGGIGSIFVVLIFALLYYVRASRSVLSEQAKSALIERYTNYDTLTNLPSRSQTNQFLMEAMSKSDKAKSFLGVFFINLDLFKDVNDAHGHDVGDEVLKETATRLKEVADDDGIVIRYGGDDFILLVHSPHKDFFSELATKIQLLIQAPYTIRDIRLSLTVSIGIAIYPEDGDSTSTLLRHADIALNNAKVRGRANHQFYEQQMSISLITRKSLEDELKDALVHNEFVLFYQPQYSRETKNIVGCEALLRWNHPKKGMIPPSEFIPAVEYSGFIYQLNEWILDEACRQSKEWYARFKEKIAVSVNLSGIQFHRTDLLNTITTIVKKHDLEDGLLGIEMNETILMKDPERSLAIIRGLKALGIQMNIDNFGTGASSLPYLKKFEVDTLKIDRTFIQNVENDNNSHSIVAAIISLAKQLNYSVIAEGIETKEQCNVLFEMGCYSIQGYLLSKPIPADQFTEFYEKVASGSINPME